MAILRVGMSQQYKSIKDALVVAVSGDTILVDAGIYKDQPFFVTQHNLSIICDGGYAVHGMSLQPSVNHATRDSVKALGYTDDEVTAMINSALATVPYLTYNWYVILKDGSQFAISVKWWANISKGICTVKAGVKNFYIKGFEFYNAKIGSTYNGAGIRGQGLGLFVENCIFHDCQNGIMTSAQDILNSDGSTTPTGYVVVKGCKFYKNGDSGGLAHDLYTSPCLFQIAVGNTATDCNSGHHFKHYGGFMINYNNFCPDTDAGGLTSCMSDASSGVLYVINNKFRKTAQIKSSSNQAQMVLMRNDRAKTTYGNRMVVKGNDMEATCVKKGSFVKNIDYTVYKNDDGSLGIPPVTTGEVSGNVFRYFDVPNNQYDYKTQPLTLVPTIVATDNTIVPIGGTEVVKLVEFARELTFSRETWTKDALEMIKTVDPDGLANATEYMVNIDPTVIEPENYSGSLIFKDGLLDGFTGSLEFEAGVLKRVK